MEFPRLVPFRPTTEHVWRPLGDLALHERISLRSRETVIGKPCVGVSGTTYPKDMAEVGRQPVAWAAPFDLRKHCFPRSPEG